MTTRAPSPTRIFDNPEGGSAPRDELRPTSGEPAWTRAALPAAWAAWLGFFVAVGIDGLNLKEDGYLLTLAERVARGEVPYRDFAYIRPPLPILIQAGWLLLTPGYAVAASRWYFAVEVALVLTAVYALLGRVDRDRVPRALVALFAVVFAFSGGFVAMPWHTYDGVLFSALAAWALAAAAERRSCGLLLAAGLAAGAAALSKQGFAAVAVAGLALTLTGTGRRIGARPRHAALAYLVGVAAPFLLAWIYLARHGAIAAFVRSVVLDPREITREVSVLRLSLWDLFVGVHVPGSAALVVGVAVLLLATPRVPRAVRLAGLLAGLLWVALAFGLWGTSRFLNRLFLADAFSACVWLSALALALAGAAGRVRLPAPAVWAVALGLATLYAANWSFIRQFSGAQGLALALPLALWLTPVIGTAEADSASRRAGRFLAGCVLLYAALLAALLQAAVPYQDGRRGEPVIPFRSERLRGIRTAASRVLGVDGVVDLVRRETAAGDHVLAFMHFPALYFLTERRNPTRVDWFIPLELTRAEVSRAVADLGARPPRLVVLNSADPRAMVESPRLRPILGHILEHYEQGEAVGEFLIFRPRR
jgi:hypothetical protein